MLHVHAVLRGHLPAETSAVKRPFGGAASAQDEDFVPKKPKEAAPKPVLGAAGLASPVGVAGGEGLGLGWAHALPFAAPLAIFLTIVFWTSLAVPLLSASCASLTFLPAKALRVSRHTQAG